MKKNILALAFTVSFVFLCTLQLFAEEDSNTFWVDFFGLPSSDDSVKDAVENGKKEILDVEESSKVNKEKLNTD